MIRAATAKDSDAIAEIYNYYIRHTVVTFEEQEVSAAEFKQRLSDIHSQQLPWLIAENEGRVAGYCYAGLWNKRASYRFSAETTIYLSRLAVGKGIGSLLYQSLFSILREKNYHAVMAGITLPNAASVAIHEKMGMHKVAHFSQVGYKFEQWQDVGYWQLTL